MLVRVNSGSGGIASYLETGKKRGREFDRELIDERLVLDGDLALVDAVIDSIETAQEGDARYLHITLGLSESFTAADVCGPDEVNLAKLKAITDAYRDALMAAYDQSEYAWYAEAHIPKVTHELHESSGEYIPRLPHVHIVLPMRNLEDGKYLNPTGHGRAMVDAGFAQAIQEQVNAQFGLRSPAENRRSAPHNPLAKHTARIEPGTPAEIRKAVQDLVRAGEVASFDALATKLSEFGQVRVRAGKDGEYLNIKPTWADKGINLKEFTRVNFDAAAAAARSAPASSPADDFTRLAGEWRERGALEARYLTSANRSHYKKLQPDERKAWLDAKAAVSRARLVAREERWAAQADPELNSREKSVAWRAAAELQKARLENEPRLPAGNLSDVRTLSSVPALHHGQARDERLPRAGDIAEPERRRKPITVAQTLRAARERAGLDDERLKSDASPSIVLAAAARLYQVDLSKYDIGSGRDGSPRILHADKQYNLGDFFTKHLNVPWATAKPILTDCYHATLSDSLPPPDRELWRSFSAWRQQAFEDRKAAGERGRAAARASLVQAREQYKRTKINSRAQPPAQRQAAMAAARAEQLVAVSAARQLAQGERAAAKRPSRNAEYRQFLTDLANQGNLAALGELRRAAPPDIEPFDGLAGTKSSAVLPLPSYKIDHHGRVTYFKDEQSIVTDSAKGVAVLRRDQAAYETALKVAVARYGRNLTLHGDQVFINSLVQAAQRTGLELTIRNADKPMAPPIQVGGIERGR